jgi:WD40 repeat protein
MPNKRVGYRLSASIKEAHGHPIYCASFSPASHYDDKNDNSNDCLKYFATCAGPYAHIYEVGSSTVISNVNKQSERSIRVRQVYCDVDKEEQFYACTFGGRGVSEGKAGNNVATSSSNSNNNSNNKAISIGDDKTQNSSRKRQRPNDDKDSTYYDLSQRQGPPLLCVAGKRGIIKVIDSVLQSIVMTLLGHGDTVNDLKCSPTNEWLLLSASKDHSIRLWNLQHGQMIAIFHGHRGQVLSLSWHHSGTKFASSAHDATIKLWKVFDDPTTTATTTESTNGKKEGNVQAAIHKSFQGHKFRTAIEQSPFFSTDSIHQLPGIVGENNFDYSDHYLLKQI